MSRVTVTKGLIMDNNLSNSDLTALRALRARGFAVVVWTPSEVSMLDKDMSVEDFEDAMCEAASEFLVNEADWEV